MLLLGQRYNFTKLELQRLDKKFTSINTIIHKDKMADEVIKEIEDILNNDKFAVVVLNTKAKVDDKIIKYLTNLKFNDRLKDVRLISIEHFLEEYLHKCYIPASNDDLHYLEDIKPFNTWQYMQKRTFDYLAVFSLFFLTFPILLYSRFKIKKQSPGTSMFKQERVGLNNKDFKCIKFRSMHINSHHDKYTRENDTRIFPWGNNMRKTRIDELPQMINVLKGDMHFIGPRAEWNILVKEYEKEIPYYHERHLVRPGITGWAQVNYPYGANIEDTRQKLMYDLYYIKHWSILLELKVIYKTVLVVVGKKGV